MHDNDPTELTLNTPPTPHSTRKAGLIGGVIGSVGLAAAILGLSAMAGAQDAPSLETQSNDAPAVEVDEGESLTDEDWADYDACINAAFEKHGMDVDLDTDIIEIDEADLLDGMVDNMVEFDFGPEVSIMDGDDLTLADFGDGDGVITITKSGDDISVDSSGDVSVEDIDWDDFSAEAILAEEGDFDPELFDDAQLLEDAELFELNDELEADLSGCDDKLPEGVEIMAAEDAALLDPSEIDEVITEVVPADAS